MLDFSEVKAIFEATLGLALSTGFLLGLASYGSEIDLATKRSKAREWLAERDVAFSNFYRADVAAFEAATLLKSGAAADEEAERITFGAFVRHTMEQALTTWGTTLWVFALLAASCAGIQHAASEPIHAAADDIFGGWISIHLFVVGFTLLSIVRANKNGAQIASRFQWYINCFEDYEKKQAMESPPKATQSAPKMVLGRDIWDSL